MVAATGDARASSSTSSPTGARAPRLPPAEIAATYGVGYRLLKNMGYTDDGVEPLVGVPRRNRFGLQEEEVAGIEPAIGVADNRARQVVGPVDALPKKMPRKRGTQGIISRAAEFNILEGEQLHTQVPDVLVAPPHTAVEEGVACSVDSCRDVETIASSGETDSEESSVSTYLRAHFSRGGIA
eukprot:5111611-Amphidinium_carterae.1